MTNKTITHKDLRSVSHAWAYANEGESGKNANHSFWYLGGELFSYSTLIAKRIGKVCLISVGHYSIPTAKHQNLAWSAFGGLKLIGCWEDAARGSNSFSKENMIKSYVWKTEQVTENLTKARTSSTKIKYTSNLRAVANNLKQLLECKIFKKSDLPMTLRALLLIDINPAAIQVIEEAAKKQLQKRLKTKEKEIKQSISNFRTFQRNSISRDARQWLKSDLIRIRNGQLETSQSVSISLKAALGLYTACCHAVKTKTEIKPPLKIDHKYSVDIIEANGNAKVGCHYFTFKEIERCYRTEYHKQNTLQQTINTNN